MRPCSILFFFPGQRYCSCPTRHSTYQGIYTRKANTHTHRERALRLNVSSIAQAASTGDHHFRRHSTPTYAKGAGGTSWHVTRARWGTYQPNPTPQTEYLSTIARPSHMRLLNKGNYVDMSNGFHDKPIAEATKSFSVTKDKEDRMHEHTSMLTHTPHPLKRFLFSPIAFLHWLLLSHGYLLPVHTNPDPNTHQTATQPCFRMRA